MRILVASHSYPRWEGDQAGAFIHRLNAELIRRGHAVTVLVPSDRGSSAPTVRDGVQIRPFRYAPARWENLAYTGNMLGAARSLGGLVALKWLFLRLASSLRREWASGRYDLVHCHWWVPAGLVWRFAIPDAPAVVTMHGTDVRLARGWAGPLAASVLGHASAVTVVSSWLAETIAAVAGIDPARVHVRPMPVDTSAWAPRNGFAPGRIATVARLTTQKRVGLFLEALWQLRRQGREVSGLVVGDGPERATLEALAGQLGLDNCVTFRGAVPPNRVPAEIGDADVFVFPAVDEGLGLVVGEALMLGIPVVAARSGGVTDMTGFGAGVRLVDPDNPSALARGIVELQGPGAHRSAATARGEEVRALLDVGACASFFENVYTSVLR